MSCSHDHLMSKNFTICLSISLLVLPKKLFLALLFFVGSYLAFINNEPSSGPHRTSESIGILGSRQLLYKKGCWLTR